MAGSSTSGSSPPLTVMAVWAADTGWGAFGAVIGDCAVMLCGCIDEEVGAPPPPPRAPPRGEDSGDCFRVMAFGRSGNALR